MSCHWNEKNFMLFAGIDWRASLVPAAAVIPAPIAYVKVEHSLQAIGGHIAPLILVVSTVQGELAPLILVVSKVQGEHGHRGLFVGFKWACTASCDSLRFSELSLRASGGHIHVTHNYCSFCNSLH